MVIPFIQHLMVLFMLFAPAQGMPVADTWPEGFEEMYQQAQDANNNGHPEIAIPLYEEALRLIENLSSPEALNERALIYNNLADAYGLVGRTNTSIDTYLKAYDIWTTHFPESYSYITTILNNMVFMMVEYGDGRAAQRYAQDLDEFTTYALANLITDPDEQLRARILSVFAQIKTATLNRDIPELDKHLATMQHILATHPREELAPHDAFLISMYEATGFMYRELKKYDKALFYYNRMLDFPVSDFFEMKYHANTAVVLYDVDRLTEALHHTQQSLLYFESNRFGLAYLTLHMLKANILYKMGDSQRSLQLVEFIYTELLGREITIADMATLSYTDLNAFHSNHHISLLLHTARLLRNTLDAPDTAINIYLLATDMFSEYYRKEAYNPELEDLHRKAENGLLSLMIGRQEEDIIEAVNRLENNTSLQYWNAFVSKNEHYLGERISELRRDDLVDIKQIRSKLAPNEIILRYYLSDEDVFALSIRQETIALHRLSDRKTITDASLRLHALITSRSSEYNVLSDSLYHLLIAPLQLPEGYRLSIIPDGVMSYIPFEILSDSQGMLIERHPIRYNYSLRFAVVDYPARRYRRFLAAYAPDYSGTSYADIQNSIAEAGVIAQRFNGSLYSRDEARKSRFQTNFGSYAIHHLAMHAVQDPFNFENTSLIFAGGERLPFYEMHTYFMPAEMVVLSACETGIGALEPGEGLMGLARTLAYSGVRSSVYSLWQVPDRATAHIMTRFYSYLKQGLPRDESLRRAKLDFIRDEPLLAHPYFWAGFVLNGASEPITRTRMAQFSDGFKRIFAQQTSRGGTDVEPHSTTFVKSKAWLYAAVMIGLLLAVILLKKRPVL